MQLAKVDELGTGMTLLCNSHDSDISFSVIIINYRKASIYYQNKSWNYNDEVTELYQS